MLYLSYFLSFENSSSLDMQSTVDAVHTPKIVFILNSSNIEVIKYG